MKSPIHALLFAFLLAFLLAIIACAPRVEQKSVVGQLLLPSGVGSRGVELRLTMAAKGQEAHDVWVLFDEQGQFSNPIQETLISVTVTSGGPVVIHQIATQDLPQSNPEGEIDLGVMDFRDRLIPHRLWVRAADGSEPGVVRVAMWSGLPPTGPYGEPVSLGSRQFPPVELGSEMEWLVPVGADSIYFLVERPDGPGRGKLWRSGQQRLIGPFIPTDLPAELIMY